MLFLSLVFKWAETFCLYAFYVQSVCGTKQMILPGATEPGDTKEVLQHVLMHYNEALQWLAHVLAILSRVLR